MLPLLYPPEHFTEARAQVMSGAREAGRAPSGIDIPTCFWLSIADDADAARLALAAKIA